MTNKDINVSFSEDMIGFITTTRQHYYLRNTQQRQKQQKQQQQQQQQQQRNRQHEKLHQYNGYTSNPINCFHKSFSYFHNSVSSSSPTSLLLLSDTSLMNYDDQFLNHNKIIIVVLTIAYLIVLFFSWIHRNSSTTATKSLFITVNINKPITTVALANNHFERYNNGSFIDHDDDLKELVLDHEELYDKHNRNSSNSTSYDWQEISRPENYVLYSTRIKKRIKLLGSSFDISRTKEKDSTIKSMIGLLIIFIPLFVFEFFFTTSRQFICGTEALSTINNYHPTSWFSSLSDTTSIWAQQLCSPIVSS
jgi:hypothetical protein